MAMLTVRNLPDDVHRALRVRAELLFGIGALPTPDGYIAAIAASRGFLVASRDTAPYQAVGVSVINPWEQ